jgi:hypothetical protein
MPGHAQNMPKIGSNFRADGTIASAQAWQAADMATRHEEWTWQLDAPALRALEAAEAQLPKHGELLEYEQADFPLGDFAPVLAQVRERLLTGSGFAVLKGLPIEAWGVEKSARIYWGLGLHLGLAVSQNGKGHALGHVKDLGYDYHHPNSRGYQTSARLPFHTDYADLVALMCLRTAKSGGLSSITSSVSVYNEMMRRAPELARTLTEPLYRTRWGEVGSDRPAWIEVPAFNVHASGVVTTYVRSSVRKAQLMPEVPRVTAQQEEAMDLFDEIAGSDALRLDMEFDDGDIQILNNHWILHSRTAYEDFEEPERRRHLMRLWLACEDGPPFPPAMSESFYGLTLNGRPNGIHIPGVPMVAPLEAT